ncbi:MAG TPA: hypothetical protein VF149_04830 [Bacillales bacterium]
MQKTQAILSISIFILLGLILYSYWSGDDLGWWLKGWVIICGLVYVVRLYEKYRGKHNR